MLLKQKKIKFFYQPNIKTIQDLDAIALEVNDYVATKVYPQSSGNQIQAFVTNLGGEKIHMIVLLEWEEVND